MHGWEEACLVDVMSADVLDQDGRHTHNYLKMLMLSVNLVGTYQCWINEMTGNVDETKTMGWVRSWILLNVIYCFHMTEQPALLSLLILRRKLFLPVEGGVLSSSVSRGRRWGCVDTRVLLTSPLLKTCLTKRSLSLSTQREPDERTRPTQYLPSLVFFTRDSNQAPGT